MRFIWATRGRTWGFRFLRHGGLVDPLPTYSLAFDGFEGASQVWNRIGDMTALRFDDPLGRKDRAGRIIPHDFVLLDSLPEKIASHADARKAIWALVEDEFSLAYDLDAVTADQP